MVAIMLDLRELTFLDCSTLHAFLAARHRANTNGHRLVLVGASSHARLLFSLTETEFLLDEGRFGRWENRVGRQGLEP